MNRDNETWLIDLRSGGSDQRAALDDLRHALLGGLYRSFATYSQVDDAFLEDTVQDALVRILDRLPQFEGRSRFVTWATSIAIRIAMSELRRRRWRDVSLDDVVAERAAFTAQPSQPEPGLLSEQRAIVDKMYELIHHQLTEKQRTALLAELGGMPQVEIGRHLGSNRNAIYKLTHDARKRLKRGLEDAGYRADDVDAAFAV